MKENQHIEVETGCCESLVNGLYKLATLPFTAINYCIKNPVKSVTMLLYAQTIATQARFVRPTVNPMQRARDRHDLMQNIADYLDESQSRRESMNNMVHESNKRRYIPSNYERWEMNKQHCKITKCDFIPPKPLTNGPTISKPPAVM